MNKYVKFGALIVIIIGTLLWLATAGMGSAKTYFISVAELNQMPQKAAKKRLRVGGDVQEGSIQRRANEVEFTLTDLMEQIKVVYTGSEPLPDTFRDGAQALCDGKLGPDGVFHATKIQAKCASKYEPKRGQGQAPVYKPGETKSPLSGKTT